MSTAAAELRSLMENRLLQDNALPSYGKDGWLHPSGLFDLCARFSWLVDKGHIPDAGLGETLAPSKRMIFQRGHALHEYERHMILARSGALFGYWRCSRCRKEYPKTGANPRPMPKEPCTCRVARHCWEKNCTWEQGWDSPLRDCHQCQLWGQWEFQESVVCEPRSDIPGFKGIRGRYDGLVLVPSRFVLQDLKFMASGNYKRILVPEEKHDFQVNTYMELSDFDIEEALIIYVNVDSMEFKIFSVPRRPDFRRELEARLGWLKDMLAYPKSRPQLLPRVCRKQHHVRAVECALSDICFDLPALHDDS